MPSECLGEHPSSLIPAGQFLWDIDAGLPAEQAGMKEGDRVLAVNGESIEGLDHQETVLRIRAHKEQVTLLVIDPASDAFYRSVRAAERTACKVDSSPPDLHSEVLSKTSSLPRSSRSCMAQP